MKTETHTANYLAELIARDRRVVARVLRDVKPDAHKGKTPLWSVRSLFAAMIAREQQQAPKSKGSKVADERTLLIREQRLAKRRQNELEDGTLVPAADVEKE
jgi:hypothetical protein